MFQLSGEREKTWTRLRVETLKSTKFDAKIMYALELFQAIPLVCGSAL